MIDDRISQASYMLDETYYMFSDERLTKRYLKHILANSSNVDEAIRRITRIQNRVITLGNYANDGIDRLNDYEDSANFQNSVVSIPNFKKIDSFYENDEIQNDFCKYLKNEAPTAQLQSTTRQCEFIRISCDEMMKQVRSYYLGLQQHEKTQQAIVKKQMERTRSADLQIYRNLKVN